MDFAMRRTGHTVVSPYGIPWGSSIPFARKREDDQPVEQWVVQKFGGTSVGKFPVSIARDVVGAGLKQSTRIAVVCSARSTKTKSEGTTNRLLRAATQAITPGSKSYIDTVNQIQEDHIRAGEDSIQDQALLIDYVSDVKTTCENLVQILRSAQHLEEISTRVEDRICAKGEKLSCLFMTAVLKDNGIPATFVDLSDLVPLASGSQRVDELFYMGVAAALGKRLSACGSTVPVVTGFFGNVPGGLLNAIGRGYTDLCAALAAVGLKAQELQVWKEVDGIFTADPRKVPTAALLKEVTPLEAAELTFYGSEVIHPFTMEQVIRARIPIRIKNVMNPRGEGTRIVPDTKASIYAESNSGSPNGRMRRSVNLSLRNGHGQRQGPKRPTAVTVKHNIVILNVHSNRRARSHGFLMNIFAILDRHHLTVDLISSSEVHVSMALHSDAGSLTGSSVMQDGTEDNWFSIEDEELLEAVQELEEFGKVDLVPNMAIVSLVGKQLKRMLGISGRFFSTLGDNNINIEMISQGASEINISCVIDEREADRALNVVHTNLFTFLE